MTLPKGVRYLAGKLRWEVSHKGKRVCGTSETLAEAVQAREQARQALKMGDKTLLPKKPKRQPAPEPPSEINQIPTSDCTTLLEMVQFLMHTEWRDAKSIRTIRINITDVLEYFTPNIPLSEITSARIDQYATRLLLKGNSNGTVNRKLAALSKVLKKASQKGCIDHIPYIQRLPEREGRVRFLTQEEEAQLLSLLQRWGKDREVDAVIVLIDTGIRTGELYKLRTEDINLSLGSQGVVFLHQTKNSTSRGVPLTQRAKDALLRLIARSNDPECVLPVADGWLRNTWDRAKHLLGYDEDDCYVPHILRHTCCSRLVQKGAPLKKVQAWMGHKSIQTTMRYAHLSPADLYDMTGLLELKAE